MFALLQCLSTLTRWLDLEKCSGLFAFQLSKPFWKDAELCVNMCGHALELRPVFLIDRAVTYASILVVNDSLFDNVLGLTNGTKV